jgi:hypothetical protein
LGTRKNFQSIKRFLAAQAFQPVLRRLNHAATFFIFTVMPLMQNACRTLLIFKFSAAKLILQVARF